MPIKLEQSNWTGGLWAFSILVCSAVFLLPAAYNGFPLYFPDTSAYLGVAYRDEWTLDRSAFYGLLFKPLLLAAPPLLGLWIVIVIQTAVVAAILLLLVKRLIPDVSPLLAMALLAATAVATSLPWHAAQLMPDALTAGLVVTAWLAASRNVAEPGTPSLWFAAAVLALLHYTHLGLVMVVIIVALTVAASVGARLIEIAKRAFAGVLLMTAVIAAHVTAHGVYFDRWSVSPMGSWFLFARLYEDGLAQRWLDRHCGKGAPEPLCDLRSELPNDSQVLLWGDHDSPLFTRVNENVGEAESWRWIDMLNQAAIGAIKDEPLAFAKVAAGATVDQFLHFQALDDECPQECSMPVLIEMRPALAEPLQASRQFRGTMPRDLIRSITGPVSIVGMLLLLPMLVFAWRRRDHLALSLLATVSVCLIANAAMAGALSDVHDRYQSRLVWLAPFVALVVVMRWRRGAGNAARGGAV